MEEFDNYDDLFVDPLFRKPGEPLDAARHTKEDLEVRAKSNPRVFSALWQQNPRVEGGNLINPEWFPILRKAEVPDGKEIKRWVRAWDLAYSEKELVKSDPDYSVGVLMGLWYNSGKWQYIIYDIVRWQQTWPKTKRGIAKCARADGLRTKILVESGGPQKALADDLASDMQLKGFRIETQNPVKDKVARAQPWIDDAETGLVWVVEGAWNKDFFDECEMFPNGAHDDQIDAVSLGHLYLSQFTRRSSVTIMRVSGLYT